MFIFNLDLYFEIFSHLVYVDFDWFLTPHTHTISHKQLYLFSEPQCHKVLFFYWLQLVDRDYQLPQLLDPREIIRNIFQN